MANMNNKITFFLFGLILSLIITPNISAKLFIESDFKVPSMAISKNVSAILRVLCFEEDLYFHASNIKGSDMAFLKENACESNGVIEYNFIQAQQLGNSTGIIRKYAHSGKDIIIYSGKGQAPVVLVKEKKNAIK